MTSISRERGDDPGAALRDVSRAARNDRVSDRGSRTGGLQRDLAHQPCGCGTTIVSHPHYAVATGMRAASAAGSSGVASRASEMTTAPTSARPRPITATTTCHPGRLRRSSKRRIPIKSRRSGSRPRPSRRRARDDPFRATPAAARSRAHRRPRGRSTPSGKHRAHALVEVVERGLRQRRREPEQDSRDRAVDRRLLREAAGAAEDEQQDGEHESRPIVIAHCELDAFSFPPAGSPK